MASLFGKDSGEKPTPSNYDRIESEIAHLKKKNSVRNTPGAVSRRSGIWVLTLLVLGIIWLYIMDPVLYSMHRYDAIQAYLYLHTYGSTNSTDALVATQIFSSSEINAMNEEKGNFQSYFISAAEAQQKADSVLSYLDSVKALHEGKYDQLDTIGKIRYTLFVRYGIIPPTEWQFLNPRI